MRIPEKLALGSVGVATLALGLKAAATAATGSVALLADALQGVVSLAGALATVWALHVAQQPADERHPYGRSKAAYLSAVLEGMLVAGAVLVILWRATHGLREPSRLDQPLLGIGLDALGTLALAGWSVVLLRQGPARHAMVLATAGRRLRADVICSLAVVAGLGLSLAGDRPAIDAILALLVAVKILWSGWALMRDSLDGLMDKAASEATLARFRDVIALNAEGAIEAHDIKSRCAGPLTFIEFHLVVPGAMTVSDAHDICDRIERVLKAEVPDTSVTIHVEPDQKRKHEGIVVL